jgi:hypothetical protein
LVFFIRNSLFTKKEVKQRISSLHVKQAAEKNDYPTIGSCFSLYVLCGI